MLVLVGLFVAFIIFLAFFINAALDKREERRLRKELEGKGKSL